MDRERRTRKLGDGIKKYRRVYRERLAKKRWDSHRDEESRQEYKKMRSKAKREMTKAI